MIYCETGMTKQEFSVLRNELKNGTYLTDFKNDFILTGHYTEPKDDCVMIMASAVDGNAIWRVASWVRTMHGINVNTFGKDYKIDPDWNDEKYN